MDYPIIVAPDGVKVETTPWHFGNMYFNKFLYYFCDMSPQFHAKELALPSLYGCNQQFRIPLPTIPQIDELYMAVCKADKHFVIDFLNRTNSAFATTCVSTLNEIGCSVIMRAAVPTSDVYEKHYSACMEILKLVLDIATEESIFLAVCKLCMDGREMIDILVFMQSSSRVSFICTWKHLDRYDPMDISIVSANGEILKCLAENAKQSRINQNMELACIGHEIPIDLAIMTHFTRWTEAAKHAVEATEYDCFMAKMLSIKSLDINRYCNFVFLFHVPLTLVMSLADTVGNSHLFRLILKHGQVDLQLLMWRGQELYYADARRIFV